MSDLWSLLARDRRLPLHSPASVRDAEQVAEGLTGRGLGVLEVPLRTGAALPSIAALAGGPLLVGAGTVLSPDQVDESVSAGAGFVVTPGLSLPVVRRCQELGVPVLPGVATPTEVMAALAAGADVVKLFPARELGGPGYLRALAGPFPQVRLVPSGGVTRADAQDYLDLPNVLAVSGSWLCEEAAA